MWFRVFCKVDYHLYVKSEVTLMLIEEKMSYHTVSTLLADYSPQKTVVYYLI